MPLPVAAVAGLVWGAIILCFDVSLMSASPDRKFWAKVTTFGLRAIVAILAALTFASAIVILIFAKDINIQAAQDQQNGLINYRTQVITPKYAAKITADNKAITGYQAQISQADQAATQAAQEVQAAQVAATCEEKGVSQYPSQCPAGTGKYGQRPVYAVRLTELQNAQANLAATKENDTAVKRQVGPQLRAAQQDLATQQASQRSDYASAQNRYAHDDGLIARWTALNELEGRSLTVRAEVLLLEALIVAVDLSAVIVKLASKTETYDNIVALERDMAQQEATDEKSKLEEDIDQRETTRQAETTKLGIPLDAEEARARDYAAAWLQIQRHQLRRWVEQETGEPWDGGVTAAFDPDGDSLHQSSRTHKRAGERGPIIEGRDSGPSPRRHGTTSGCGRRQPAGDASGLARNRLDHRAERRPARAAPRARRRDPRLARQPGHDRRCRAGDLYPWFPQRSAVGAARIVRCRPARPGASGRDRLGERLVVLIIGNMQRKGTDNEQP